MAKQYNPWTGFLEDTAAKANDSKTCDGKNEYEIHYTVPGKNGTMVGSGKGTNEQEAREDFMAYHKSENPTVMKVKLYKSLDKAIRNCDEEQYYKFVLRGGAEYYGTESDMREFFSHLTSKEKKELGTNYKSKTPMSKEEVERWRRNAMNKLGL